MEAYLVPLAIVLICGGGGAAALLWGMWRDAALPVPVRDGMRQCICGPGSRFGYGVMQVLTACMLAGIGLWIGMTQEDVDRELLALIFGGAVVLDLALACAVQRYLRRIYILFDEEKLVFHVAGLRGRVVRWDELEALDIGRGRQGEFILFRLPGGKKVRYGSGLILPGFSQLVTLARGKTGVVERLARERGQDSSRAFLR